MTTMTTPKQSLYDITIIRDLIEQYDSLILESLGLSPDKHGNVTTCCPIHHGDNTTAFTYKAKIHKWGCWTNHCHKNCGSDILGLIQALNKCTFQEAIQYVMEVTGQTVETNLNRNDLNRKIFIRNKLRGMEPQEIEKTFNRGILEGLDSNVEYFRNRGFRPETLKAFGAFFCNNPQKPLYGRACLTIINGQDEIVGFTGRKTTLIDKEDSNDTVPKWKHMPLDIKATKYLFGLNRAKGYIKESGVAILVEGPLDIMRMHEAGFPQTVSTFGNNFSDEQRQLLIASGAKTLLIAYDPDKGGDIGTDNVLQKARLFFNAYDIRDLIENDPGDLPVSVLIEKLKGEVDRITQYEKNKYE